MIRSDLERRQRDIGSTDFQVRDAGTKTPIFTGHAAVFGQRTAIGNPLTWGFLEELDTGVFDRTLSVCDARFLVDHDTSLLLARQSAGDLRLRTDDIGLDTEADMDTELSYARDFVRNLSKRRITGMSFGFEVKKDKWDTVEYEAQDKDGNSISVPVDLRTIMDVDLWEVSGVTFPAYDQTDAALRALSHNPDAVRRREQMLTDELPASGRTIGRCLDLMAELRAGKSLSAANVTLLTNVLERIDAGVDGLTQSSIDLSGLLGVSDQDDTETKNDRAATQDDQADLAERRRRMSAYAQLIKY